jgi:hypothetical protein
VYCLTSIYLSIHPSIYPSPIHQSTNLEVLYFGSEDLSLSLKLGDVIYQLLQPLINSLIEDLYSSHLKGF